MSISKCLFNKFWNPFHSQNALKIDQKSTTYQLKNKNNFWPPWDTVFFHFFSSELTFQNWKKCPKRGRGCIFHTSSIFNIQSLLIYLFLLLFDTKIKPFWCQNPFQIGFKVDEKQNRIFNSLSQRFLTYLGPPSGPPRRLKILKNAPKTFCDPLLKYIVML